MKLEAGRITTFQYLLSVTCFIQSSTLLTAFFTPFAKQDSWFVVLLGIVAALPVLFVYKAIMHSFRDMNLIEICQASLGRFAGTAASLIFIWFFLTLTSLNLSNFSSFMHQTLLIETPVFVIATIFILLCAYTVHKGLKVVTRYAALFVIMAFTLIALVIVFTYNIADYNNFLPMLMQPVKQYVQSVNILVAVPFGELLAFLMITPYISRGKNHKGAYLLGGFLLGSTSLLYVVLQNNAVLGSVGHMFPQPPFEMLRMVNIGGSINRLEVLFAIILIILLFFKIAFLYYISVLAIAQLFRLKSYHPLVLITGAMIIVHSTLYSYHSSVARVSLVREQLVLVWLVFEFLLPLVVLVAGRARGLHKAAPSKQYPNHAPN